MTRENIIPRAKTLNFLLLIAALLCRLEWGSHAMFLFELEYDLFTIYDSFSVLTHPAVLLPFVGQFLLLVTLLQPRPSHTLAFVGMALLGLPMLLIFIGGLYTANAMTVTSTLPFFVVSFLSIRNFARGKRQNS